MKRILLIFLVILLPIVALAEDYKIGSYVDATNGKPYSVDVRLKNEKIEYVYVYMSTKSGVTGYFNFKGKDLQNFYNSLCEMRNKYCDWAKTAKENNIVSFTKEFDYTLPKGNLFWIGNKTWFASGKRLTPLFVVVDYKPMIMLIETATALQNKYITETFSMVFADLAAYDDFIQIFNPEEALKRALENQNITDKFK